MYLDGRGVERDSDRARELLQDAMDAGSTIAGELLMNGDFSERRVRRVFRLHKKRVQKYRALCQVTQCLIPFNHQIQCRI